MFDIEYCCQFASGTGALIDTSLLQTFQDPPEVTDKFMGIDWARTSDGTSVVVIGRDNAGVMHVLDSICLHNVEYEKQLAVVKEMFTRHQPKLAYGDAGGLGSPLCEQLNKTVSARIKPFVFTGQSKPQCYELFRSSVFDRKLKIHEDLMT